MTDSALRLIPGRRLLTAEDLDIGFEATVHATHASNAPDAPRLSSADPLLAKVKHLLSSFGGVIFSGPPGTGKTYVAAQIAEAIAGDQGRVQYVQFHASYQYDEFMEGFVPTASGFVRRDGAFLKMCRRAQADPDNTYVLVVDELSRADAARVFGEALTYVERSKRGLEVTLASGNPLTVPNNLEILATMNPVDRGVDEVDAAFERRFAKIKMDPDRNVLGRVLENSGLEEQVRNRVMGWFSMVNKFARDNPSAAIGHAYFVNVDGIDAMRDVWEHQLQFAVDRAFRLDPQNRQSVETGWKNLFIDVPGGWDGKQSASAADPPEKDAD
ncbi:AAA family ATPase [Mycetocola zhujimingii]|uniref:AAA family ATPase n=1 Tax=Mycetocola zhujimingii TaxID=2079792 RepID=UPI000D39F0D8|nr:AAA family ATPase [Mycetocola zhujimingii]AWB87648.1 ATPase [Mycetocola zhujimingii]